MTSLQDLLRIVTYFKLVRKKRCGRWMGNKELINVGLSSTTGEFDFVGV